MERPRAPYSWWVTRGTHVSILGARTYAALAAFFVVAAVLYGLTLELTSDWSAGRVVERMTIDYALKALLSVPAVYLAFVATRRWPRGARIALVLALALPYAFAWRWAYYAVCDAFAIGHLDGYSAWWDIYIPLLVYAWQFAALFAWEYHADAVAASTRASALAQAAVTSELTALRAQMNPHFLYNTYNAISASLPPELESTRELLAQLAGMFRYQVSVSREALVPLSGELDFLRDYLGLEQVRMGDRLRYAIDVDAGLEDLHFPPLLLQPLIENAIRHGLSPKLAGGTVALRIERRADDGPSPRVWVTVSDDGVGLDAPGPTATTTTLLRAGTGVGLATTRKRLELQFGAALDLRAGEAGGTVASFALPLDALRPGADRATSSATATATATATAGVRPDRARGAQISPARG